MFFCFDKFITRKNPSQLAVFFREAASTKCIIYVRYTGIFPLSTMIFIQIPPFITPFPPNGKAAPEGGFDLYLVEWGPRFYLPMLSNSSTIPASGAGVSRLTITITTAEMMKAGSSS